MAKYKIQYLATASSTATVEADSLSEAREIADDQFAFSSICAQCSGWGQDYNMDISEWEQDESDEGAWEDEA